MKIIIPSRNSSNLVACIGAILKYDPDISPSDALVIDNGAMEEAERFFPPGIGYVEYSPVHFNFSEAINLGFQVTDNDDCLVLNDDALLQTPSGFTALAQCSASHPDFGMIAASTNNCGNPNQYRKTKSDLRPEPRILCLIAVFIPRSTISKVGFLDPAFPASHNDDDFSYRVRQAGLKLGVLDACFVDHQTLPSTFRSGGKTYSLDQGREIFIRKWGAYPL